MKKLTEAGTGIVTVTQMLTLLGNNQCFEEKQESHLRQRVRGVTLADRYHKEKVVDYIGD